MMLVIICLINTKYNPYETLFIVIAWVYPMRHFLSWFFERWKWKAVQFPNPESKLTNHKITTACNRPDL
jgi:hypothetical protein